MSTESNQSISNQWALHHDTQTGNCDSALHWPAHPLTNVAWSLQGLAVCVYQVRAKREAIRLGIHTVSTSDDVSHAP
jgi:hypothetical protein